MESSTTKPSSLIPFKSTKPILTTPVKKQPPLGPTTVTPDRPNNNPPSRTRNRNFALSVSDVRRAAALLRKPDPVVPGSGPGRVLDQVTRVGVSAGKINGSDNSPALLDQKYDMLCEFFNAMVSSIRLLRLKRLPTTLTKLSRSIESLTVRRFTLHHLGQLKHIMPEVIAVKKIRVQDEETGCMKEDLLISLQTNELETDKIAKGSGGYSHLKGIFHSRIVDYATNHPETDDIPEGELPELFYKPKQEPEQSINHGPVVQPTALTAPSFKRRFSSKALSAPIQESFPAMPLQETPIKEAFFDETPVKTTSIQSKFDETPVKSVLTPKFASTPVGAVSTPARLMAVTPALRTPKRSLMTDDGANDSPNKSAKRRALKLEFDENSDDADEEQSCQNSDTENDVQVHSSDTCKDLLGVLPENLLHSLMEKELKTIQEQDPIVLQARKRQQLMSGVPKLFDIIKLLFQSIKRSVMTKEELIQKIITGHMDIIDKGEVEEQLTLLQEIAPEFITEYSCLSGDTLLRLNKFSCVESIRAKLLEGK